MPAHTILKLNSVPKTTGYSHCARAGNTLYIAGQVAQDKDGKPVGKGDIELQAKQVYTNLRSTLTEAGVDQYRHRRSDHPNFHMCSHHTFVAGRSETCLVE